MATLAKSQRILRDDYLDVRWPHRERAYDGWIGDAAHEQSGPPEQGGSDHNPNKRGIVDGLDIDIRGIHVPSVIASMIIHPSTRYVIFNRRIMSSQRAFEAVAYTGKNPHDKHLHRSIFQSSTAENRVTGYKFILQPMNWNVLRAGAKGAFVGELQAYLIGWGFTLRKDMDFGPKTLAAVRSFQSRQGIRVDGVVGATTRDRLRSIK